MWIVKLVSVVQIAGNRGCMQFLSLFPVGFSWKTWSYSGNLIPAGAVFHVNCPEWTHLSCCSLMNVMEELATTQVIAGEITSMVALYYRDSVFPVYPLRFGTGACMMKNGLTPVLLGIFWETTK